MNKKYLVFAALHVALALPSSSPSQWTQLDRPGADFRCLAFSGSSLFAVGSMSRIYSADSTGSSWTRESPLQWITQHELLFLRLAFFQSANFAGGDKGRIFRSTNGGLPSQSTSSGVECDILDFARIQLSTQDLYFACGWGSGVLASEDSGATWLPANVGLPNLNLNCIASGESPLGIAGQLLFAGTYGNGIYRSTDNGGTWIWRGSGLGNQFVDDILIVDTTIFAGLSGGEVYLSTDWGEYWQKVGQGSAGTELLSLAVLDREGERWIFAGTIDAGIWRAVIPGGTWEAVNTGLQNMRVNSIAVKDSTLFVGTHQGVYRSIDFGDSWTLVGSEIFPPMLKLMATDREDGVGDPKLFVGTPYYDAPPPMTPFMGVYSSESDGASWDATPLIATYFPSMSHYGKILLAVDGGDVDLGGAEVFSSTDWGETWRRSVPDDPRLKTGGHVLAHLRTEKNGVEVFWTTGFALGCICMSTDSARTWSVMYGTYPKATGLLAAQDSLLFFTGGQKMYRLHIDSQVYTELTANLPYTVISSLASTRELLFSGFVVNPTYSSNGGLYFSNDYGDSWSYSGFDGMTVSQIIPHEVGLFVLADGKVYYSPGMRYGWTEIGANLSSFSVRELSATPKRCYLLLSDGASLWRRDVNEIIESSVPLPTAPILLAPSNGETSLPISLQLKWSRPQATEGFRLQVSSSSSFALPDVVDDTAAVDTSYQISGLRNGTTYSWRVCGKNLKGYGPWSDVRSFTTIVQAPQAVSLVFPPAGAVISSDTVLLSWVHASPSIDKYWVEAATDSVFQYRVIDSSVTDTTHTVRGLQNGLNYWWRVKAHNAAGWSAFSEARKFAVVITSLSNQAVVPEEYSLFQNYPNPFNPSTSIRYGLPRRSYVKLEVYGTLGQRVAELVNTEQEAGFHEIKFDGSALASGIYLYRLQAAAFVATKKLLLVK